MKDPEPDDPMELHGIALPGDTEEAMAECFIEEYLLQGFQDDMILRLFTNPQYVATYRVWQTRGDAYVRGLIAKARAQWGHVRFRTEIPKSAADLSPNDE
jgi:hypothetical protein